MNLVGRGVAGALGLWIALALGVADVRGQAAPVPDSAPAPRVETTASPAAPARPWDVPAFSGDAAKIAAAAAAVEVPAGSSAVWLLDEARCVYDAEGKRVRTYHSLYRIVRADALSELAVVTMPWGPWYLERPVIRARVIAPDGATHELDAATIDESPLAEGGDDMFDDRRMLRAPLPAAAVGSVVETEIVVRDKTTLFDKGSLSYYAFGATAGPVLRARYDVRYPASLPMRYIVRLMPGLEPRRTEEGGVVQLVFEAGPIARIHDYEPFGPPDAPIGPFVLHTTGRSWTEVAARYAEIVDDRIRGGGIDAAVKAAIGDATTPEEKANRILSWVHRDFRYTGVEFNEAAIVPRTLAEVLERKYGDCKDLSTFVVAALRSAGLKANVALLQSGAGYDVEPDMPGMGLFNHAIVLLEGATPLWIDPTSPYSRAGELPTPDQGRRALVASPSTKGLVTTPRASADENEEIETRDVFLSEGGKATFTERTQAHGSIERFYRGWVEGTQPEAVRASLESFVKTAFLATSLDAHSHMDPRDLSARFWIDVEAGGCGRGVTDAADAAVGISLAGMTSRLLPFLDAIGDSTGDQQDPLKRRTLDLILPEPESVEWRYVIHLPPGYAANRLPEEKEESLGGGATLKTWFEVSPDATVVADIRLTTVKDRFTPEEFRAFRKALEDLSERRPIIITFNQVGEAHLSAGRVREALTEFRRLAALHPKESMHHRQIAYALLAAGMGAAAREEGRQAIELEPTSSKAHFAMGMILERDLVGRLRHAPGFDRAGALAALRKAKELDPKSPQPRSEIGILLEYDAEGDRYTKNADLEGALSEYRSMRKDLDDKSMDVNILFDLCRLRRFEEAETFARPLDASQARTVAILTAVAAREGAPAALAEAQALESNVEEQRKVLAGAVLRLLQTRSYPEAAALLRESAKGAPDATQLLLRADVTAKTHRVDEVVLPDTDPASVVKLTMLKALTSNTPVADITSMLSREAVGGATKDEIESMDITSRTFGTLRRSLRRGLEKSGLTLEIMTDLIMSTMTARSEGDDAGGYRTTLTISLPNVPKSIFFVVKESGRYKVLGSESDTEFLGVHALGLLDAHDLPGARRCLDWAREAVSSSASSLDPLREHPFHRLYTTGSETDPEAMRLAAASLAAVVPSAVAALGILEACRKDAPVEGTRTACQHALVRAFAARKKWKELDEAARRLVPSAPDSATLFGYLIQSAAHRGDDDEVVKLSEARLAAHPDDPDAIRAIAHMATRKPIAAKPEWSLRRLVETGKAEPQDYNELAWKALVDGHVDDEAMGFARRAASQSGPAESSSLHTLACLYAETDHPSEAYTAILQSMEKSPSEEPRAQDWYVFGRLAELYGFPGYARDAYGKVTPPEDKAEIPGSTYALARKRLAALDAADPASPDPSGTAAH